MNRLKKYFAPPVVRDTDRDFLDAMQIWMNGVRKRLDCGSPEFELEARLDVAEIVRALMDGGHNPSGKL